MGLFGKSKFKRAFEPYQMPGTPGIGDGILAETKPAGFWQGGEKFGVKDGVAGLLAVLGDAFSQRGGGEGGAVQMLAGGRMKAAEMAKQQAQQEQVYKQLITAGVPPEKAPLIISGVAKLGDVMPQAPELPTDARLAEWYRTATPEQRAAYDQTKPIVTQGYGSTVVPRSSLPTMGGGPKPGTIEDGHQFMGGDPSDPKSWKPLGGGAGNGVGGFPRFR